jgi:FtsP/CotA-like multicopper oxidase with cupredoxin domain
MRATIAMIAIMAATAIATSTAAAQPAAGKVLDILLVKGRAAGEETLRVKRGERVELRFASDRPIMLHLHGYDIERKAAPQMPAVMAFEARIAGRFPVSEHAHGAGHHRAIVYLEVHP